MIEDFDSLLVDPSYPIADAAAAALYQKMLAAQVQLLTAHGGDPTWGRRLYRCLRGCGLVAVAQEGYLSVWPGESAGVHLRRANFEQTREEAVAAGLITDAEVEQVLRLVEDPAFAIGSPVLMTAWGRRPTPAVEAGS